MHHLHPAAARAGTVACQPQAMLLPAACCLQSDEELLLLEAVEIYGEQHTIQQAHLPAQRTAGTAVSGGLLHSTGLLVLCRASA